MNWTSPLFSLRAISTAVQFALGWNDDVGQDGPAVRTGLRPDRLPALTQQVPVACGCGKRIVRVRNVLGRSAKFAIRRATPPAVENSTWPV